MCLGAGTHHDLFFLPLGNRAGPLGLTIRHLALTPVWVPSGPPLALCYPDRGGYGLPRDQEIHPQGPGCEKRTAGIQGGCEDRGLWPDERPEPRDRPLCHVRTQEDPVCMVRAVGKFQRWRRKWYLKNLSNYSLWCTHLFFIQVCSREPSCRLLLPFLRRVDVWRHPVGDVHLLWRALVRPVRQTGTRLSATFACVCIPANHHICLYVWNVCPRPDVVCFRDMLCESEF